MMDERVKLLTHEEALDAICGCAGTVTVLSYQEAIEGYLKLRGISSERVQFLERALIEVRAKLAEKYSRHDAFDVIDAALGQRAI